MEKCVINWLTLPSDMDEATYLTDCYENRKKTLYVNILSIVPGPKKPLNTP